MWLVRQGIDNPVVDASSIEVNRRKRRRKTDQLALLATQGVQLTLTKDFPRQLEEVRLWDGSRLPPELHGRLGGEWLRRESVVREIEALEAEQRARLQSATDDPALEQVRALMKLRGIEKAGNTRVRRTATEIAWSWIRYQPDSEITRWLERRFADAGKRARRRGAVAVARKVLVALRRYLDYGELPEGAILKSG